MRNLKRALSLALASVMLLGMMVVGSSAAAGYSDVDVDDNVEAIEVLQAVEVMVGDDRGFGPDRPVTRNEMAVVMGKLLNLDYNYYVSTCPFTDVADWAKGWVGACAANGIVSGRGNGIYDGESTVTAIEAASMMMRALGYFKNTEDYADGFQVVTVRQGSQIGIFRQVGTDANTPMTRNQVAQMALNALRTNMVDFTGTPGIEVNGVKVGYRAEYTPRTSPEAKYNAIADLATTILTDNGQYYVQLGEELYDGDLRLNDNSTDEFGRPSRYWEYDGKAIGTYMKKELIREEYTTKVTGKMLYELLTKDVVDSINRGRSNDYTLSIAIDGEEREAYLTNKGGTAGDSTAPQNFYFNIGKIVRGNTDAVGGTGKGVLTQVFVDTNKKAVDIAIINTYLAKANEDYASRQDKVTFTVYAVEDITAGSDIDLVKNTRMITGNKAITTPLDASGEDFDVKDVKKDDIYLVTVAEGAIQTLTKPEVLSETSIDAFKKTSNVTVGGQKYDYANTAKYDDQVLDNYTGEGSTNLKDKTYNVYLDKYGYAIGVEEVEKVNNYVFITGYDGDYSYLSNKTADMGAIFPDGRFEVIKVKTNSNDSSPALFAGTANNKFAANGATAIASATDAATNDTNKNGVKDGATSEEVYNAAIVNTWCTYTVNSAGEYSLTIVDDDDDDTTNPNTKAHQSRQSAFNTTDGTGAVPKITIDTKRVQLTGADGNYVFANDETVFINTELEYISIPGGSGGTTHHGTIISDVESVTTGVRNVNLEVTNKTAQDASDSHNPPSPTNFTPIYEVYTLYNTDRDIIAVVTLDAEDNGSNSVYAYVTSSNVNEEAYSSADDEYTWSREVVIDGEITKITYKGDKLEKIGTSAMAQGSWYELKLNADGHVRKAELLAFNNGTSDKYQSTVASVVPAWNNNTTVEILHDKTTVTKLTFSEGTLWTNEAATTGISVATDVKVVVCNANDAGTRSFDSVEDGYTGYSGLNNALNDLNSNFKGTVSAIYDGGRAKVLILNCTDKKVNYNPGANTNTGSAGKYSSVVDSAVADANKSLLDMSSATNYAIDSSYKIDPFKAVAGESLSQQIKDFLAYKGYTDIGDVKFDRKVDGTNAGYTVSAKTPDGVNVDVMLLSTDIDYVNKVTLKTGASTSVTLYADDAKDIDDILSDNSMTALSGGKWVKGATSGWIASDTAASIVSGDTYDLTDNRIKVSITAADVVTDAVIDSTVGYYTTTFTVDDKGEKVGNNLYVKADATVTVRIEWTSTNITGGTTGDSIAIALTGATVTTSPVAFANGTFTSGATTNVKTATISTFVAANAEGQSITLTGSHS